MILSDTSIKKMVKSGELEISPFNELQVEPASYDVRLSSEVLFMEKSQKLSFNEAPAHFPHSIQEKLIIPPNKFLLGSTVEKIKLPPNIAARVDGRSSIGRLGLTVHATAGFIDPGFNGTITLEIHNSSELNLELEPFRRIAQIVFYWVDKEVDRPYGHKNSKYQSQNGPTPSLIYKDF